MADEEKKDETTESSEETTEETKVDAETTEETSEEETTEEETEEEASDTKIDYKAEHEKEKERADAAEKALANDRYKSAEAKRKEETTEEEEEDKPLTKSEYQAERAKDRQILQKQLQKQEAQAIVKGLTDNVDEQNYVLEIHKNRIFPENLSLQEQLEESHAIANRKKWKGERDEAMRKAKGDEGANTDASVATRKPPASKVGEPSMSAEDKKVLIGKGWKWNTTNRRYEKTTASGVLLFRDPDTGAVKTARK